MSGQGRGAHLGSVLRYALAAASCGAGLIHLTAVFDHTEHPVVAAFFVILAVVQVGWAVALVRQPSGGLLKGGAVISAGVLVIWLASRTTGLPGVPGAEEPEPFGLKDGMASLLEVLLAAGIGLQFLPRAQRLRLASGRLASGLAVSVVGVLTAAGLAAAGHGHHHGGAAHDRFGSAAAGHGHSGDGHGEGETAHGGGAAGTGGDHAGAGPHDAGHVHGAGDGRSQSHAGGDDHHASGFAAALGPAAGHDHNAPGHVHDPSHHHAPGHVHDPSHHHAPGHVHDPSHHLDRSGQSHPAGGQAEPGQDHEEGGAHHGGRDAGEPGGCTSPLPANQVVTTLQETAQSALGAGCHLHTSGPTAVRHRHRPLRLSPQHFIS